MFYCFNSRRVYKNDTLQILSFSTIFPEEPGEKTMRKVFFILICFTAIAAVHTVDMVAAGINIIEFRGQRYLYLFGSDAVNVLIRHASGQNINNPRINTVISNNRLNIVIEMPSRSELPRNIRQRNYIQYGDLLLTVEDFNIPIEIIYRGQRRDNISFSHSGRHSNYFGFGYAQGGVISILEIVTFRELERNYRLVE